MRPLLRRVMWWVKRRRKEDELREELQFHLDEETEERRDAGLPDDEARWAARRDLGNEVRLREDVRSLWSWRPLDELAQDLRYAFRTLFKARAVTIFAVLSLALGIGANTAIYSFMDAILLRALPVPDPPSLVVMTWQSKAIAFGTSSGSEFVMHSIDGSFYKRPDGGVEGRIFPYRGFERLRQASTPVVTSLFTFFSDRKLNVLVDGEAELSSVLYVSGEFFRGVAVPPAAGRGLVPDDDRAGAPAVAVVSAGYGQRRFGSAANAVDRQILINNVPFTIVGVASPEFFGVDPGSAPSLYLPMHANLLLDRDAAERYLDQNYYWAGIMGRLRPGVGIAAAQSVLATAFEQFAASTATTDGERANLPMLRVQEAAGGLDTLRRKYSKPLYVLLTMVGLILAIACANTANLLLARATARQREIAVRISIGAGRGRLIRQLLTESLVLSLLSGALGVLIAIAGTRLLTVLLAAGSDSFTIDAEVNWHALAVTLLLSIACGVLFGLVPALQSTRPALVPALKDASTGLSSRPARARNPRLRVQQALVAAQISLLMVLLVAAGLFARTLSNLQSIPLGFNPDRVLLFDVNAVQAGYAPADAARYYADLRRRLSDLPGIRAATLSHASLIRAGRQHPVTIDGVRAQGTRLLQTGPGFFTAMQIPILAGREIDERDRAGTVDVAVISDLFARRFLPNESPLGRRVKIGGSSPMEVEIVGVAASARYGPLKYAVPPVLYIAYAQVPALQLQQMTYALRTDGEPMRYVPAIREAARAADSRVPITNITTQTGEIDQTINQEIVLARLCTSFAAIALLIACVGLYGTMAYAVVRRTREIGIRMALGAQRRGVVWMVLREACVLTAVGLAISLPIALGMSRFIESFLFDMKPNDPRALGFALAALLGAALAASYGPARRASRIDPAAALRHD